MKNLVKNNNKNFLSYLNHEYAGIYLHIPFCEHKCGYCDFYSASNFSQFHQEFIRAMCKEIENYPEISEINIDSIFFGGGTPSMLDATDIALLLSGLASKFTISPDCEISLEANPGTVNQRKMKDFAQAGINRLSFGVQSFDDKELALMERIHKSDEIYQAIDNAIQADIKNISIDLIFALPNQSLSSWESSIKKAMACPIQHISAYSLIFERNTPFYLKKMKGELKACSDELEREMMELSHSVFLDHGFKRYEVSNYAKNDQCFSRHNLKYWQMKPYFSFGPSAHSYNGYNMRWWNIRSTELYINNLRQNKSIISNFEILNDFNTIEEWLLCYLRLETGLDLNDFYKRFAFRFELEYAEKLSALIDAKLLILNNNHLYCSENGLFYLNEIIRKLTE